MPQTATFDWGDTQTAPPPSGGKVFEWGDEEEKRKNPNEAEMRAARPDEVKAPQPYRKFSGPFVERAASQFGQDLNDITAHPSHLLPSWKDITGPVGQAFNLYDQGKELYNRWKNGTRPEPVDPAETVGHLGVPVMMAVISGGADEAATPRNLPKATPRAANVRLPGEIPPYMPRPRAVSPYAPAEPIPARSGLALPAPRVPGVREPVPIRPTTPDEIFAQIRGAKPTIDLQGRPVPAEPPTSPAAKPSTPSMYSTDQKAWQRYPAVNSPQDLAETKAIREQVRETADQEQRGRLNRGLEEGFARNTRPRTAKAELSRQFQEAHPAVTANAQPKPSANPKWSEITSNEWDKTFLDEYQRLGGKPINEATLERIRQQARSDVHLNKADALETARKQATGRGGEDWHEKPAALSPNASGESAASKESLSRMSSEKSAGVKRVVVDTRSGIARPLIGPDAVDYQPRPYESVEFRGGNRDGEVISQGRNARPYRRSNTGRLSARGGGKGSREKD